MGVQIVKLLGSAVDVNVNINPAGAYNAGTTYNTGDVVEYNGSSYIAKQGTTGNLPTDTTYWQLLAEKGDTGAAGATGDTGPAGVDGTGWTGGSYDAGTGVVTFTSDDGLGFSTGDLRGADGADGLGVPAGGTTGQILSKVSNTDNDTTWSDAPSGTLDGLTDTTLTTPADGEVLQYDSGTSKWVNATASGGGGPSLYTIVVDAAGGGDYTTISAALAAASAGDAIYVKAGTYNDSWSTSLYDIALIGESNVNTEIVLTGTTTMSGGRYDIRNLKFNTGTAYQFNFTAYYSSMRNCIVTGNRSLIMYAGNTYNLFSDNYFESTGTAGKFYFGERTRVVNNRFVVPHVSGGGIYLKKDSVFANNYVYRQNVSTASTYGLLNSQGGSATAPGSVISGNVFSSGTATVVDLGVSDTFLNNTLINSGKYGIKLNDYCTVGGNIVHNAHSTGYCVYGANVDRTTIVNNRLVDASAGGYGVRLESCDRAAINSNVIEAIGNSGIDIVTGCTNIMATSNMFSGCTTDINDSGTGTVTANNIAS